MVRHIIGNDIPVPGGSFRRRTISPEFGKSAREIATFRHGWRVREASGWIERAAMTIVRSEAVVALRGWGNVQHHTVVWCQLAPISDHFHDVANEVRMTRSSEKRRGPGINPRLRRISTRQCEGSHAEPLRAEIILDGAFGKSILICSVDNLEPLPAIDIHH